MSLAEGCLCIFQVVNRWRQVLEHQVINIGEGSAFWIKFSGGRLKNCCPLEHRKWTAKMLCQERGLKCALGWKVRSTHSRQWTSTPLVFEEFQETWAQEIQCGHRRFFAMPRWITIFACNAEVNHHLRLQWRTSFLHDEVYAYGRHRPGRKRIFLIYHVPEWLQRLPQSRSRHGFKGANVEVQMQPARRVLHVSFHDIPHGMLCNSSWLTMNHSSQIV